MEQPKERKGDKQGEQRSTGEAPLFPVKKVVLSKTGIGYFEREDAVDPGRPFELYFKSGDMNDVLKSLAMVDLSSNAGGLVSSISYESTKPFDKQLEDLSISLNEHSCLRELLIQVKGTPVAVEVMRQGKRETVEGTIIGLEDKMVYQPSGHDVHFLALLVAGKAVQYFNLAAIKRLRFLNELMQQDLRHLLSILLQAKKKDLKSVTGYARGGAAERRKIRASYIVEAPVWKTTYRLLFYSAQKETKSILEGWALVDNTQNEDWRGVELSLVSGASNSFIYDLYNPRYAARTEIEVEQEETLAPPTLEDAVAQHDLSALAEAEALQDERERVPVRRARVAMEKKKKKSKARSKDMVMASSNKLMMKECEMLSDEDDEDSYGSFGGSPGGRSAPPPPAEFSRSAASSSVEVNSEAKKMEMADLFQYKITSAVNVLRNQSALVPFLHTPFDGVKASVYNKNVREDNPLAVIKFKNTYGVPLEGGPLSLFEDDAYVGEAMLPRVQVNAELFVAYAVDLKTSVTMTESSHLRDVYRVDSGRHDWERGRLYLRRWRVYEFTYVIDNKNDRAIDHFYLEHPKKASVLIETPEPDERLDHFYRFKLAVPAQQVVKFVVKEQLDEDASYDLRNITSALVREWVAADYLPADARKTLETIVERNEEAAELQKQIDRRDKYLTSLAEDISRCDSCLGSLALSNSGLFASQSKFRDYFTKELNASKSEQGQVEKERQQLTKQRNECNKAKNALAVSVSFSKPMPTAATPAK